MKWKRRMRTLGYGILFLFMPFSPFVAMVLARLDSEAQWRDYE